MLNESRTIFANNLKYYIEMSGRTQKEIAEVIGVAATTMHEWVSGKKFPRIDKLEKVTTCLGIQKSDLFEKNPCVYQTSEENDKNEILRKNFAKNLKMQMVKLGKNRKEVSEAIGVSYFTFSDWVNGKKYPRMSKIEALANYFGVTKADLIEVQKDDVKEKSCSPIKTSTNATSINKAKKDVLDIVLKLHSDAEFLSLVELVASLDKKRLRALKQMIDILSE